MKNLKKSKFSNGVEEFSITRIENGIAYLFTKTGIQLLNAEKNSSIKIGEKSLINFLENELNGFSKIEDMD